MEIMASTIIFMKKYKSGGSDWFLTSCLDWLRRFWIRCMVILNTYPLLASSQTLQVSHHWLSYHTRVSWRWGPHLDPVLHEPRHSHRHLPALAQQPRPDQGGHWLTHDCWRQSWYNLWIYITRSEQFLRLKYNTQMHKGKSHLGNFIISK